MKGLVPHAIRSPWQIISAPISAYGRTAPVPSAIETLASRGSLAVGFKAAQGGLAFLAMVIAAHWLDPDSYGRFAVALSWLNLLAIVAACGLPTLLLRLAAVTRGAEQWSLRRGLLHRSVQAPLVAGCLGVAATLVIVGVGAPAVLLLAAALAGPLALLRAMGSWLLAEGRVVAGYAGDAVLRHVWFLVLLALAVVLGLAPTATTAMTLLGAGLLAALGATAGMVSASERQRPSSPPAFETRAWAGAALPLMAIGFLHAAMATADVLMLGALAGAELAGGYHLAARTAQLSGLLLVAMAGVLGPEIARQFAAGQRRAVTRLAGGTARALTAVAIALLALAAGAGPEAAAWVHPALADAHVPLLILLAAQVANAACGPVALLLNMAGRERDAAAGIAIGAAANLVLNAALIPAFGAVGAAAATGLSLVLWNVLLLRRSRRRVGVDPSVLGRPPREVRA